MKNETTSSILLINYAKQIAKKDFWAFCKLLAPDFYTDSRPHLKKLCTTLQLFYERKKIDGKIYKKLMIEMPPQHGKSRTLTLFCAWVLGRNNNERIITGSYNDTLAQDFSKYTRNIIQEVKNLPSQIVFSDIFPTTKIKYGDSSLEQWALVGQFFSYKGTGINGTVTGKGATIRIIDDPIKSAEEAYNENALDKVWRWYSGTWISRRGTKNMLDIVCNTPWAKNDLSGRLLDKEPGKWLVIRMPAYDGQNMLCDELLGYEEYKEIESVADPLIFAANYRMERIDKKGILYTSFATYDELPEHTTGNIAYCDTADEGNDFLCSIHAKESKGYLYVTNVLYTQLAQEYTEPMLCDIIESESTREITIESNNGGRAFARNVQRILGERKKLCNVKWFHQSQNKQSRIFTNSTLCQKYILFPTNWNVLWPEFYSALASYQRVGKNKHDDAPDALTGIIEKYSLGVGHSSSSDVRRRARI